MGISQGFYESGGSLPPAVSDRTTVRGEVVMDNWELLSKAVSASKTLNKLHEFVIGGALTKSLAAMGDVHFESAIDHLSQAPDSKFPAQRINDAAGDLQVAYYAFSASAKRGVPSLRQFVGAKALTRARGMAAGCAANIAVLQLLLDESPENRRHWVDRAGLQISQYWRETEARSRQVFSEVWILEDFHCSQLIGQYFQLEEQVLPIEHRRDKPLGWIPSIQIPVGAEVNLRDPAHVLPRIPVRADW